MYKDESKSYLVFGKDMNRIIKILQSVSNRNPQVDMLNDFVQKLKDMRPYEDMLNDFIFGDQKSFPKDKKEVGEKDAMTLEEMMKDLELRFMDGRDKDNGKN
jgi:hypothetical protein|tara:strand:- start:41 stop:346 length:306 start_codon:yes stop_codon:yes gene_type:complete